jgi:hypothetical protein
LAGVFFAVVFFVGSGAMRYRLADG